MKSVPGSCVMVTLEGTRPLLVEIQALVDECHGGHPRRVTLGLEQNRLAMLLSVLVALPLTPALTASQAMDTPWVRAACNRLARRVCSSRSASRFAMDY